MCFILFALCFLFFFFNRSFCEVVVENVDEGFTLVLGVLNTSLRLLGEMQGKLLVQKIVNSRYYILHLQPNRLVQQIGVHL